MKIPCREHHDIIDQFFSFLVYVGGSDSSSFLILSVDRIDTLIKGASSFANVVFPTPGKPLRITINTRRNALYVLKTLV